MTPTEQDKELRDKVATIVEYWDFSPLQDEDTRIERLKNEILQLITDYTNKQTTKELDTIMEWHEKEVEAVLDRLEATKRTADLCTDDTYVVKQKFIEAERNKLKDRDDDQL